MQGRSLKAAVFFAAWALFGVANILVMRAADVYGTLTPNASWIIGKGIFPYIISLATGPGTLPFTAMAAYEALGGVDVGMSLLMLLPGLFAAILIISSFFRFWRKVFRAA